MTTSTVTIPAAGAQRAPRLPGFGALAAKELTEWRRSRRIWVVLAVSGLFMALTALNAWLQATFLPADGSPGVPQPILDPVQNLIGAVGGQIFVVAAVFASMGLLAIERENGTLAWTFSKPVSRASVWLSKLGVAVAVLWIVAGIVPLLATVVLVTVLYGAFPLAPVGFMVLGIGMAVALFVAIVLAASTAVSGQAAVAAIAIGAIFLPQLVGLLVPAELLPTSILQWALATAVGAGPSVVTVVVWAVAVAVLVAFALRRMDRLEL